MKRKELKRELLELKKEFKDSLYWTNYDQRRLNNTNKSDKIKKNIKIYEKQKQLKDLYINRSYILELNLTIIYNQLKLNNH